MITVVFIENPLIATNNIKKRYSFKEEESLFYYLNHISKDKKKLSTDFVVAVNGFKVDINDYKPQDQDIISITPKVEGLVSGFLASYVVSFLSLSGVATYLTYGAVYLGSMFAIGYGASKLLSVLSPPLDNKTPEIDDQNYGWGDVQNSIVEGNPIPILFGTNKVYGQVLNYYTKNDNDDQYLYMLIGICDHEVNAIDTITINGKDYTDYENAEVYTGLGTANDAVIPGFGDSIVQDAVNTNLDVNVPVSITTTGDMVEEIDVMLTAPEGLYYFDHHGDKQDVYTNVKIEYKKASDTTYTLFGNFEVRGNTTTVAQRTYTIASLPPDQYDVQVTRTDVFRRDWENHEIEGSTTAGDVLEFAAIHEIVKGDLIFPGLAKFGVKLKANEQLNNSMPTLACYAHRDTVPIFDGTDTTDQRADSPAWICLYILQTLANIPFERINYDDFQEWADYCDETVDSDVRFRVNIIIGEGNFWDNLQKIAFLGDASIINRVSQYGVFIDKPGSLVSHVFSMGNIVADSYKMQYLDTENAANCIEIDYNDVNKDQERQSVAVYTDGYLTGVKDIQPATLSLSAAISRDEAIRHGILSLNNNLLLKRVITFDAYIDSFACIVKDLIYFQHIATDEGTRIGGRIIDAGNDDGSGNPFVTFDQKIPVVAGTTYGFLIRQKDDSIIEKILAPVSSGEFDTFTIQSSWVTVPDVTEKPPFIFGVEYKKIYRITSITRQDDFTRTITAIEYNPLIYSNNQNIVIPDYVAPVVPYQISSISCKEILILGKDLNTYQSLVNVSWTTQGTPDLINYTWNVTIVSTGDAVLLGTGTGVGYTQTWSGYDSSWSDTYTDMYQIDANTVEFSGITTNNFTIPPTYFFEVGKTYKIYVSSPQIKQSNTSIFQTITIKGQDAAPADVTSFQGLFDSIKRIITFTWAAISDIDIDKYELREGSDWQSAIKVIQTIDNIATVSIPSSDKSVSKTYLLKAIDTSGNESANAAVTTVDISATGVSSLEIPTGLTLTTLSTVSSSGTDVVTLLATWDNNAAQYIDFNHYDIQLENLDIGKKSQYSTTDEEYQWQVVPATNYGVTVRAADNGNNVTDWCTQQTILSAKDTIPPSIPTTLKAVGTWTSIILTWKHGAEADLSNFIVLRNDTNDSSTAVELGIAPKTLTPTLAMFTDSPPSSNAYYYWVKAVDTSGNESALSNVASASAKGVDFKDINIPELSITETMIADDSISTPKLQANSVTTNEIAAGAVKAETIAANAITAQKIAAGEIGTQQLAADAVIASKIDVDKLSAISADIGVVTAGKIQNKTGSSYFDLDNNLFALGTGFTYNGVDLNYIGNITIKSGTGYSQFVDKPTSLKDISVSDNELLTQASTNSDFAISLMTDMQSDSILSPAEKATLRANWSTMYANYMALKSYADILNVGSSVLVKKADKLYSYLVSAGVWSHPDDSYKIVGNRLVDKITAYYTAFTDLTSACSSAAANLASDDALASAQSYAEDQAHLAKVTANAYADGIVSDSEQAMMNYAKAKANAAKISAKAYSDGKITKAEKKAIDAAKKKADAAKLDAMQYTENWCDQGADVTSTNFAKGIVNQGDLATKNVVGINDLNSTVISNGKITTNLVDANSIVSRSITANEIATNTITANEIAAGAITASEIGANKVITCSANIGDLVVDTLNIAGNAVTVPLSINGGYISVGGNAIVKLIEAVNFPSNKGNILIQYSSTYGGLSSDRGTLLVALYRGNIECRRLGYTYDDGNKAISFAYIDNSPNDTDTYTVYCQNLHDHELYLDNLNLSLLLAKK